MSDAGTDAMEGKPAKRGTGDSGFDSTYEDCGCPPAKQPKGAEMEPVSLIAQAATKLQDDEEETIRHEIREGRVRLVAGRGCGGATLSPSLLLNSCVCVIHTHYFDAHTLFFLPQHPILG